VRDVADRLVIIFRFTLSELNGEAGVFAKQASASVDVLHVLQKRTNGRNHTH